jgi:hypothetical protein
MKFQLTVKGASENRIWGKRGNEHRWVTKRDLEDDWKAILFEDMPSAQAALSTLVKADEWCVMVNERHGVKNFVPYKKGAVAAEIEKVANGCESESK